MRLFLCKTIQIIDTINIIIETNCDILIGPIIRLSVLNPSINILANEYVIKYKRVSSPLNFLLFDFIKSKIKIIAVQMDSYRNVGCTST